LLKLCFNVRYYCLFYLPFTIYSLLPKVLPITPYLNPRNRLLLDLSFRFVNIVSAFTLPYLINTVSAFTLPYLINTVSAFTLPYLINTVSGSLSYFINTVSRSTLSLL
jgi:hypothetical protein